MSSVRAGDGKSGFKKKVLDLASRVEYTFMYRTPVLVFTGDTFPRSPQLVFRINKHKGAGVPGAGDNV